MKSSRQPRATRPRRGQICFEEALALERQGAFREAFQRFQQCVALAELDRGDVYFHLGWCVEQDSQPDRAMATKYYRRAAALSTNPLVRMNARFRCGWLFMQQKAHRRALQEFEEAVKEGDRAGKTTHRLYGDACYWYALMLEAQQRHLDALTWHTRVAEGFPALEPESRYRQIRCRIVIGDFTGALQSCQWFNRPVPEGFSAERFAELQRLAQEEQRWLEACLQDSFLRDEMA